MDKNFKKNFVTPENKLGVALGSSDFITLCGEIKNVEITWQYNPVSALSVTAVGKGTIDERQNTTTTNTHN